MSGKIAIVPSGHTSHYPQDFFAPKKIEKTLNDVNILLNQFCLL